MNIFSNLGVSQVNGKNTKKKDNEAPMDKKNLNFLKMSKFQK